MTYDIIRAAYESAYKNERFVRVMPDGVYANIKNVRMSNYCDISLHADNHTGMLIICSCIDNMVKGAAGQAIQNMNIRFGLDEDAGLLAAPPAF
jgi:N-acetyl-gamma-glutamyl-phosphate reductase